MRKVIVDQDTLGPASTNLQAVLVVLKSAEAEVLGITVPSGDGWRDHQVRCALRLLEIAGRTDVPVVPGAVQPLVNNMAELERWERLHGRLIYKGAWDLARPGKFADPYHTPDLPEGNPQTSPAQEHAASFMVRMARAHPGEVTILAMGPMTNIALACALDPDFPRLARELHFMGGAFNPVGASREFKHSPRREFNLRWDPEASRMALRAPWRSITCSPIDVANHTRTSEAMYAEIAAAGTPVGDYLRTFGQRNRPMWDEVAAASWLEPALITDWDECYMDVDLDRGAGYGNTLSWSENERPGLGEGRARVQRQLDEARFYRMFIDLMRR